MLFGSLVKLHVWLHSYLYFSLEKTVLKSISAAPRHLLTLGLSIELFSFFLSQSRHLSIVRSIDQETYCPLDSSSIHQASFCLGHLLDSCICWTLLKLDTFQHLSICRELLSFYLLGQRDLGLISLDLSRSLLTLHLPKPLSLPTNLFLKDFSVLIKFFFTW